MKKEAKTLLGGAIDSLLLAAESFNRPWDRGRPEAVLIWLDHAFELFLKAAIIHRGGRIRERRANETYGFHHCVRKCLSDAQVKCLNENQALTMRMINGLRDAAMHYFLTISEEQLYLCAQAGMTLFDDLLQQVFSRSLSEFLPQRVLPISTQPPTDIALFMDQEFSQVIRLLEPGKRKRADARSRLRPIAIMDKRISGKDIQPTNAELDRFLDRLIAGEDWPSLFPGVGSLRLDTTGSGLSYSLRISKTEGVPTRLIKEGEEAAWIVAVRRVNELGFYGLGFRDLEGRLKAEFPNLKQQHMHAIIDELGIRENDDYYKEFLMSKGPKSQPYKRYSRLALDYLRKELPKLDLDRILADYKARKATVKEASL